MFGMIYFCGVMDIVEEEKICERMLKEGVK